jgi:hypothetical protein
MSRVIALTLAAVGLAASTLSAHHSYALFDREHPVSVEGEIERVVFANPHVIVSMRTGEASYSVEWGNLNQMVRWNITKDTLHVGDHIVVTAAPTHDPADRRLSLVTEMRRPVDGWRWSR